MKKIYILILWMAYAGSMQAQNALGTYLQGIIDRQEKGLLVTAKLIEACQLLDTLNLQADNEYTYAGSIDIYPVYGRPEETRNYYGYTLFAETDETWEGLLGQTYTDITVENVKDYVLRNGFYPEGQNNADYADENNVLNLFVTYHLLSRVVAPNRLVNHVNELGYNEKFPEQLAIPVCDYYVTMGHRRLLRTFESKESEGVYLNRFPMLDNARQGTYHEIGCDPDATGIFIDKAKAVSVSDNSMIYPIDRVLAYDSHVRNLLAKTRMRHDFAGLFDGLTTNACQLTYKIFPASNAFPLMNRDGLSLYGRCDFTFRLPPVSQSGTYEIRLGLRCDANDIVQVCMGTDPNPNNLTPVGKPILLTLTLNNWTERLKIGWSNDTNVDEADQITDNELRYHGIMKAPKSIGVKEIRNQIDACRIILATATMDPDKTYYIRLKSMLDTNTREKILDYIEICPKVVYDNPDTNEDIW